MTSGSGIPISCQVTWREASSLSGELAAVAQAGFGRVEIENPREAAGETVRDALAACGLEPTGLVVDLSDARQWSEFARSLGLSSIGVRVGNRRGRTAEILAGEVERGLDESGEIGLELCNRYGSALEQLGDFRELFVRVPDKRLTVVIDTLEFHRASVDPRGAVVELADRAAGVVLADAVGNRQVPLGEGEVNIPSLLWHLQRMSHIRRLVLRPGLSWSPDMLASGRQRLEAMIGQA